MIQLCMVVMIQTLKCGEQGFVIPGVVLVNRHDGWGSRAWVVVFVGTLLLLNKGAKEAFDGGVRRTG